MGLFATGCLPFLLFFVSFLLTFLTTRMIRAGVGPAALHLGP